MALTDTKQQLKDLLTELFQLNNSDLDFGIYRILNIKSKEIEQFIEHQLDEKVEEVKAKILARQGDGLQAKLDTAKETLVKTFQVDFQKDDDIDLKVATYGQLPLFQEQLSNYKEAKARIDALQVSEETERSIYNELYRFFDRYYEAGDFVSKPRAGQNNYLIPYDGEEVKLYWANHDQYYIKTGENFKNYLFHNQSENPDTFTQVEFKILDVESALNNNKEEKGRLFVPAEEPVEWIVDERKLLVKFYYKVPSADEKSKWGDKQNVATDNKGINQRLYLFLEEKIKEINDPELFLLHSKTRLNAKKESIPLIKYHLHRYVTVSKADYFIHKDLRGFLKRELDFFLKNEILSIQFLDSNWKEEEVQEAIKSNVLRASAIRDIAVSVIDFVSELEDFQKRLFEKKKFVVQSDYCLTLDRIPSEVYDEITEYILNDPAKKQIKEWKDNLKIVASKVNVNKEYLIENDKLIIDTQYLPDALKWKLIASINNLDEAINGVLINSENLQALSLLRQKYLNKIKCIYIDPPYNTGDNDFLYKDNYRHSSWISMMNDRFKEANKLLSNNGAIFTQINEKELNHLIKLQEKVFGDNFVQTVTVRTSTAAGFKTVNPGAVSVSEYITWFAKNRNDFEFKKVFVECEYQKDYNKYIVNIEEHPTKWTSVPIKDVVLKSLGFKTLRDAKKKYGDAIAQAVISVSIAQFALENANRIFTTYAPHKPSGILKDLIEQSKVERDTILYHPREDGLEPFIVLNGRLFAFYKNKLKQIDGRNVPTQLLSDFWDDLSWDSLSSEGGVTFKNGKKPEQLIRRILDIADVKPTEFVLDYFAGSATTAAAATKYGVKWLTVEMGSYFDDLCLPRLKKVLFGEQTGISKIQGWKGGGIFQYLKLEQYEDTLNNISFGDDVLQLGFLENIKYQLTSGISGSDSLLNLDKFTKPFNYSMKIVQQNEVKEGTKVDLVTTFNFLLGIDVVRYKLDKYDELDYRLVFGKKGKQAYLIVWRNYDELTINLTSERDWLIAQEWFDSHAILYCNGDNAFGANPIEPEFSRLMTDPIA